MVHALQIFNQLLHIHLRAIHNMFMYGFYSNSNNYTGPS